MDPKRVSVLGFNVHFANECIRQIRRNRASLFDVRENEGQFDLERFDFVVVNYR